MKRTSKSVILTAALALALSGANAQGVLGTFKSAKKQAILEKNAPSLRDHLKARKVALEAWNAIPASELQPVTLTANVVAKNRAGYRELRVREFHYIGDCGYGDGGQDAGVETQTTAAAVFASDLADSYINQAALAGIDIGGVLIGMHVKPVVVPIKLKQDTVGKARIIAARYRPRFVGGSRAVYDESIE